MCLYRIEAGPCAVLTVNHGDCAAFSRRTAQATRLGTDGDGILPVRVQLLDVVLRCVTLQEHGVDPLAGVLASAVHLVGVVIGLGWRPGTGDGCRALGSAVHVQHLSWS